MCIIVAHVGIAGSTKVGDGVQIGGQAELLVISKSVTAPVSRHVRV